MNWSDFNKVSPSKPGYCITYCTGVGLVCPYILCMWDGEAFNGVTTQITYPLSISKGKKVVQSCEVIGFVELTEAVFP